VWSTFFPQQYGGNILDEVACDPILTCNRDQVCFKGLMANWLSTIALIVPYTYNTIMAKLDGSAVAAGLQCSGPNSACGMQWFNSTYDGTSAIEQEMSALSIFSNTLVGFTSQNGHSS
jgi:mannan endo-1,6-alpha-mannosidase